MKETKITPAHRRNAAKRTFTDVLGQLRRGQLPGEIDNQPQPENLEGKKLSRLLEDNFARLDPDNNGITKEELASALISPERFSSDEYVMLKLVGKYFKTIANMCNDQIGPETVITQMDKDVLIQFLAHSNLTLADLHAWRALDADPEDRPWHIERS